MTARCKLKANPYFYVDFEVSCLPVCACVHVLYRSLKEHKSSFFHLRRMYLFSGAGDGHATVSTHPPAAGET